MIERLIEDWLDRATERTFQVPVCQMLQAEGFRVVHLSRHCGTEFGKDIIAVDKYGRTCGFQLKTATGRRITLSRWRTDIEPQIIELLHTAIVHPSVSDSRRTIAFLVTNRDLDEEVIRCIDDLNRKEAGWPNSTRLRVWVRGDLIDRARRLGSSLWPSELPDSKALLEMYLADGGSCLEREKLAKLLARVLRLDDRQWVGDTRGVIRRISSAALLCASATSAFSNAKNYWAEIQAWTIFVAHGFGCAELHGLEYSDFSGTVKVALDAIYNCLGLLCEELEREGYTQAQSRGEWLAPQKELLRVRVTLLMGLMSVYALWRRDLDVTPDHTDEFIRDFCIANRPRFLLWGECAVPQALALYWYLLNQDGSCEPDRFLGALTQLIARLNDPNGGTGLSNIYHDEQRVLPVILAQNLLRTDRFADPKMLSDLSAEAEPEDFRGASFSLEGLLHLLVRRNWKQAVRGLWPDVSKIDWRSFYPSHVWEYYRWRVEQGENAEVAPPLTKHWLDLQTEAKEHQGRRLPRYIKQLPQFFLLFLIVYPHRLRADAVRWLDSNIQARKRP